MKRKILALKPTQMAFGVLEVDAKVKQFRKLAPPQIRRKLNARPVEIVIAPDGSEYIVDGHHRAFAAWLVGMRKIPCRVLHRFPKKMSCKTFWKQMRAKHWTHLYDASGDGPHNELYLPRDVRGIGNDPYRSLAWLVRENGGYAKTDVTFSDFQWANFFRKRRILQFDFGVDYENTLERAVKLAHSVKARHLPGYISARRGKKH